MGKLLGRGIFHHADCFDVMRDIPDHSIGLVLCDLPYSITCAHWDQLIPFDKLWAEYRRIIKPNAAIVLTASQPFTTQLIASNYRDYRYNWVWEKPQGVNFLNAKRQPMKNHEDICVFSVGAPPYFPQMTPGKPYISGKGNSSELTGKVEKTITVNTGNRYPKSVQRFNRELGFHSTQKPVPMFEYLIRTYTNSPDDIVLDNCIGSGTTAIAAENVGRRWIGIERDDVHAATALKRIEDHLK